MSKTAAVLLLCVLTTPGARAQRQVFEVASVKQNTDVGATPAFRVHGGEVAITAYPLLQLVAIAYDSYAIQTRDQITGGPAWIRSDRFDITAKANGNLDSDETGRPTRLLAMLRSLFEDRFTLRTHSEHRTGSAYLLMRSRTDGRLGPKLRQSGQQDCRGPADVSLAPDSHWCGWRGFGTGHYQMQGLTMEDVARGLASAWSVSRPVFDRTGLRGRWDATVDFVPTFVAGPNAGSGPVQNPAADSGPDLLAALRDQLGLKLQGGKADIEYLVIDRVERPKPD